MNLIINNVLSFIQSAMDCIDDEKIIEVATAFYIAECVATAKMYFFYFCGVPSIKRRASKKYPNPTCSEVEDIIELFRKMTNESRDVPKYVCEGFGSLPSADFSFIAGVLCSLKDEIASLRFEIMENRKERENDIKTIEDANSIKEELSDIKIMMKASNERAPQVMTVPGNIQDNVKEKAPQIPTVLGSQQAKPTYSGILLGKPGHFDMRKPHEWNNWFRPEWMRSQGRGSEGSGNFRRDTRGVVGTKKSSDGAGEFGAAQRMSEIYIGRCDHRTTTDGVKEYCKRNKIDLKSVEALKTVNPEFKSFKITAAYDHEVELMKPDFWLSGLLIRKFYRQKRQIISGNSNSNNFIN